MYKKIKNISALIMASFATELHADVIVNSEEPTRTDDKFTPGVLNMTIPTQLAAHRSHSSHGSHRSHRSSSGGGGYSAPSGSSSGSSGSSSSRSTKQKKQADPLGQEAKPKSSYPPEKKKSLAEKLKNKEVRRNVIMQIQLRLQFEEYYKGSIDGVMGPSTREAIMSYKKAKGIPGKKVLDAPTLNAMGILVN